MTDIGIILAISFLVIVMLIAFKSLLIVREDEMVIVERLGAFYDVRYAGLHFIVFGFDRVANKYSTRMTTFETKQMISKMLLDKEITTMIQLIYIIKDVKLYHYGVQNIESALNNLIKYELDKVLIREDYSDFNLEMENISLEVLECIKEPLKAWGIEVYKIVLKKVK